VEKQANNV